MGGSSPAPAPAPAPAPVDIKPQRDIAESSASARRARQRRSSLLSSATSPDALGSDSTLGTGEKI